MKRIFFAVLILLAMAGVLCACQEQQSATTAPPIAMDKTYIGFSATHTQQLDLNGYTQVDESVFDSYEYRYSGCSDRVYYDTLGQTDQKVYRILQYAMDHAYPCILIDDRATAGMEHTIEEILTFFSLDSAVVEQNLAWQFGDFTVTYTTTGVTTQTTELKGMQLYINDFSAQKQAKKDEAIAKAEQILAEMPENCATDQEKAQYFYSWLGQNVEYFLEKRRDEDADYLYDALCKGKTNCDGFANAFSLRCAMEGIRCIEKIHVPEDGSAGHTWNAVYMDGVWYNVDATASSEVKTPENGVYMHFGFPDEYQEYACKFQQLLPECNETLYSVWGIAEKPEDVPALVESGFSQTQQKHIVIVVKSGALEQSVLEQTAQQLGGLITTRHYILADGSALYCVNTQ